MGIGAETRSGRSVGISGRSGQLFGLRFGGAAGVERAGGSGSAGAGVLVQGGHGVMRGRNWMPEISASRLWWLSLEGA